MDENPYQSPQVTDALPKPKASGPFYIDGDLLIDGRDLLVTSETVLPPICVLTGELVSKRDRMRVTLTWCPHWVALLFLLGGCGIVPGYFLFRRTCVLTYALRPGIRPTWKRRFVSGLIAATAAAIACVLLAANIGIHETPLRILLGAQAIIAAALVPFADNPVLRAVGYRNGKFRIRGCSLLFLDRLTWVPNGGDDSNTAAPVA
jgi:hypothetical protein